MIRPQEQSLCPQRPGKTPSLFCWCDDDGEAISHHCPFHTLKFDLIGFEGVIFGIVCQTSRGCAILLFRIEDADIPSMALAGWQVDVSGFTRLSETFSSLGTEGCEEFSLVMSRFLATMCKIIQEHGGDIDCFAGDALLVAFSSPRQNTATNGSAQDMEVGGDSLDQQEDMRLRKAGTVSRSFFSEFFDTLPYEVSMKRLWRSAQVNLVHPEADNTSSRGDHALMMSDATTSAVACATAICRELNGFQASENHPPLGIHAAISAGTVYAVECGKDAVRGASPIWGFH